LLILGVVGPGQTAPAMGFNPLVECMEMGEGKYPVLFSRIFCVFLVE